MRKELHQLMTPLKKVSEKWRLLYAGLENKPYIIINLVLAGVVLLIMIYSGIFSPEKNNYPITCVHEKLTGEPCASCGLSHSFSLILRGRIDEAYLWNRNGMRVFLFFISQLIIRLIFSGIYLKNPSIRKQLVIFDIIGSTVTFLIAFMPFILFIFRWI